MGDEDSESQTLIKARRVTAATFAVSDRSPVQFAWLVRPNSEEDTRGKIRLQGPEWGASTPNLFPPRFKQIVLLLYWMVNYVEGSLPSKLPWDFWIKQVIAWLPFDSFNADLPAESSYASTCGACGVPGAKSACGRCKSVRYCNKQCQQKHWPSH